MFFWKKGSVIVENYFQPWINTHLVHWRVFTAAGWCMWDGHVTLLCTHVWWRCGIGQQWRSVAVTNKLYEAIKIVGFIFFPWDLLIGTQVPYSTLISLWFPLCWMRFDLLCINYEVKTLNWSVCVLIFASIQCINVKKTNMRFNWNPDPSAYRDRGLRSAVLGSI